MYGTWPDGSKILCSYNPDLKTCDAEDYFTTVSLEWVLPGLLLGLGAVITTTIAYIVYASCCCKCCQWCAVYGASHYIIKGKFLKHRSHFWKKVYNVLFLRARMYRVLSIVTSLLIICFLFVILGIQIKVETATATFRTRSETFAVTQANVLEKGVDTVNTLPSAALFRSQTSNELVAKTKLYVKDIRDQTDKVDAIKDAELGKFIPEMVFITLLICLATCGMLISLWGQKQLLLIYAICIILALLPIFLYWSSSTFLEAIFSDICSDKDLSAEGGNSAIKYGIVKCNGSSLADMRAGLANFYKEVEVKACIYTQRMCVTPNIQCPTTTCSMKALPGIIEKTSILDNLPCGHVNCTRACQPGETTCYSRNMTLPACTKFCKNVSLQNTAISSRTLERDAIMFGQYYSRVFMPVATCKFVDQYLHYIDRPLCKDMMMIGVSAVFTLLVAILFTSQFFIVLATHMTLQKKERSMYEMAYHPDKSATS